MLVSSIRSQRGTQPLAPRHVCAAHVPHRGQRGSRDRRILRRPRQDRDHAARHRKDPDDAGDRGREACGGSSGGRGGGGHGAMSVYDVAPLDVSKLAMVPLAERASKVSAAQLATRVTADQAAILDSMPDILGAADLRRLAAAIVSAKRGKRAVLFGLGAHVLKVGLSPILIQLVEEGFIDGIALNGGGIVHDYEIAACGATSEDVDASLPGGRFGVTRETGESLNAAIKRGAREGIGIGEAVGRLLAGMETPTSSCSIVAA